MTPRKRGRAAVEDRERILRRDRGLCQVCLARGVMSLAVHVDHIVALMNGGDDSDSNKQAICKPCHDEKTREDKGQRPSGACDESGWPTSPRNHWNAPKG